MVLLPMPGEDFRHFCSGGPEVTRAQLVLLDLISEAELGRVEGLARSKINHMFFLNLAAIVV